MTDSKGVNSMQAIFIGFVLFVIMYLGGFALHIWTAYLFWHHWGPFWGVVAFFMPVVSELVAVFACFSWHIWYFVLAIALWLVSMGAVALADETNELPFRKALFIGWTCVVGVLLTSFVTYAWSYSLGPTSKTATDQSQLEDCAVAVIASLSASDSGDPSALASLVTVKKKLKGTIRGYDKDSLDELCSIVDASLRFERSIQNDFLAYIEEVIRTGRTLKFTISDKSKQALSKLPSKLRAQYEAGKGWAEAEITKQLDNDPSKMAEIAEKLRESIHQRVTQTWTTYGQTYSELLGRPMPSFEN